MKSQAVFQTETKANNFSIELTSRLIIPHFLSNGGGAIAVMSSAAGKAGAPFSGKGVLQRRQTWYVSKCASQSGWKNCR